MWLVLLSWCRRVKVETVAWIVLFAGGLLAAIKLANQKKQLGHAADAISSLNNQITIEKAHTKSALELVAIHNKREDELRTLHSKEAAARKEAEDKYAVQQKQLAEKQAILEETKDTPSAVATTINNLRGVP